MHNHSRVEEKLHGSRPRRRAWKLFVLTMRRADFSVNAYSDVNVRSVTSKIKPCTTIGLLRQQSVRRTKQLIRIKLYCYKAIMRSSLWGLGRHLFPTFLAVVGEVAHVFRVGVPSAGSADRGIHRHSDL